jgi:hypothetical protein
VPGNTIDVVLTAEDASNNVLATYDVTQNLINSDLTENPGNAYFVVEDNVPNLSNLVITQTDPLSPGNFSGLAIADVQVAPEPSTFLLLAVGVSLLLLGNFRLRKRA